jgi:hypothetical protein
LAAILNQAPRGAKFRLGWSQGSGRYNPLIATPEPNQRETFIHLSQPDDQVSALDDQFSAGEEPEMLSQPIWPS